MLPRFEVQFVDIGLALPAPGNTQEPVGLQRFEVLADIGLMQAHVLGKPFLARIAIVVLPRVAEQYGEGELVARAEVLRLEQEVWDLGEAAARGGVGVAQDDVAVLENVANVAFLAILHMPHYTAASGSRRPIPYSCCGEPLASLLAARSRTLLLGGRSDEPSNGVSISCRRPVRMLVSLTRSSRTVFCSRKKVFSFSRCAMYRSWNSTAAGRGCSRTFSGASSPEVSPISLRRTMAAGRGCSWPDAWLLSMIIAMWRSIEAGVIRYRSP